MQCSACGVYAEFPDGFCSACGVEMADSRLPVKRQPSPVPALWRRAAPAVARGAALIAAGIAAEFLLRTVTKGAVGSLTPSRQKPGGQSRAVAIPRTTVVDDVVAVSRTVITRRVVVRRG